ncbi:hypothetical protein [Pedobacter sp.]|uniref:hypothetical protein n=1 Tax=Pedobacter sp. TaxID=1411316 RepID=UPI0031DB3D47
MLNQFSDPIIAIRLINILVLITVCINSSEIIFSYKNYTNNDIFDWEVLKYESLKRFDGKRASFLNFLYRFPNYIFAVGILLVLSLISIAILFRHDLPIWLNASLLLLILMIHYRTGFGMDGADQLTGIILFALLLGRLGNTPLTYQACIWFIALQSVLSYFTAGYFKLISPVWQNGSALSGVMNSVGYGHKDFSVFLIKRKWASLILSWMLIVFEVSFPLSLFFGKSGAIIFIIGGIIFHFLNAMIMGLNNFFWAFVATYPAIIFAAIQVRNYIN